MQTISIVVLVTPDCPHAQATIDLVERLAENVQGSQLEVVTIESEEQASTLSFYGSPTVLVDSRDIEGQSGPAAKLSCRLYGVHGGIPPNWMVEAALLRAQSPKHILFLCVANSARSQMAEGVARALAPSDVRISSAGSQPTSVRPEAIAALAEKGIDITSHVSQSIDEIASDDVEAVVTLCAQEVCPVYLGGAYRLHWGLPDPAAVIGPGDERMQAFRDVRDELFERLRLVFS